MQFLLNNSPLRRVELKSENYNSLVRFLWGDVATYEVSLSLRSNAYLCHGTAVFLHGLNDQIPKVIYVNGEQSLKPTTTSSLTQVRIDLALSRPQRTSNYVFDYQGTRIILLSGKNTNRLEVATIQTPNGESVDCTKIERTLIDITVRPTYSGGIFQVLEAYRAAKDRMSTNVLAATLKKLAYVYPYHQAVGFLLERAGYPSSSTNRFRDFGLNFDFYLVHGATKTRYDSTWRIHYPEGL